MLRRVLLALWTLALASVQAHAQLLPGRASGFRPGFQFIGGAGGFPASGAIVDYDFRGDRYSGPPISVSRASPKYIDDSTGNWTLVPANALARSDKGTLIEGAQTNSIRNSSAQGTATGTPGTLANFWTFSLGSGISRTTVAYGTVNGLDCADHRIFGSSASSGAWLAANIQFEAAGAISASTGQLWTLSAFIQIVAGTTPGTVQLEMEELTSSNSNVRYANRNLTVDGTLRRYENSQTLSGGATTAAVRPGFWLYGPTVANTPMDVTVRLCAPQMEQWSTSITTAGGASSPIRTTGTAATRAADVLTVDGLSLTDLTIAVVGQTAAGFNTQLGVYAEVNDGSTANRIQFRYNSASNLLIAITNRGGAQATTFPQQNSPTAGALFAASTAISLSTGQTAIAVNGASPPALATTDRIPIGPLTRLSIGNSAGTSQPNAYLRRLVVWPYRAANDNVSTYSTLSNWGG